MAISAKDAKLLTRNALQSIDKMEGIRSFIEIIDGNIKNAAAKGLSQLVNPFNNLKDSNGKIVFTSFHDLDLLKTYYMDQGFQVGDSPATDPGDPRGDGSFTYLRW